METTVTIPDLMGHDTDHDSVAVCAAWAQHALITASASTTGPTDWEI